ncbi:MAG TPA: energy-coupling factor transporter ATPase [Candidatus Anoxymicrobiaceae bacterium]|jgi:energy-coupling factor transport system ATP-binding protein
MEKIELVEIENLSYTYPGRDEPALRDVSMSLSPGEFVLLAGASGSGKSTLCRAMNGLVPHFYGGRISGSVRVAGIDTATAEVRDIARTVGMVFQDPENQMVTDSPVSEIAFGLENTGVDRLQMRKRVEEVMASLRLSELRDKRITELSGGQKQKVALASVLAMHPGVLVLDEPTSQLDPISAEDFLSQLKSLNDELGLVVVLAEHRVERCFHFADRVVVLDGGRAVFSGTPAEMARWSRGRDWAPLPPVTRLFLSGEQNGVPLTVKQGRARIAELAAKTQEIGSDPLTCVSEDARVRIGGSDLKTQVKGSDPKTCIYEEKRTKAKRVDHRTDSRTQVKGSDPKTCIETRDLWYVYDDGTEALRGVDLTIGQGEFVAVIGENGSGKTTLVRHFNGLLRPSKGKVLVRGKDIKDSEVASLAAGCGMLGQNPNNQLVADTVVSELEATLEAVGTPAADRGRMIDETLELLQIAPFRDSDPQDLSCGERERVALASVLVHSPGILVLDEPTRGIDQATKDRLAAYLREYNARGNTVILVTHDLEFAAECCERVLLMGSGQVLADGDKHAVLADSLFFTTQYNKCFRGVAEGVVTSREAHRALEALS